MTEILLLLVGLEGLIIFVQSYLNHQQGKDINRLREMLHREQLIKSKYHRELEATNKKAPLLDLVDFEWPEYTVKVDEVV